MVRNEAVTQALRRWVRAVEASADAHVDQGRPVEEEAHAIVRKALERLCREDLGDKVVFVESGTFSAEDSPMIGTFPSELPPAARRARIKSEEVAEEGPTGSS